MTYKMIVLDIDDTLVNDNHEITPLTKQRLIQAQQQGVKVVLASGRPTYAMKGLAKELELDQYGSYILSFNGGLILDCQTEEFIYENALTPELVHELVDISEREDAWIHTYIGDDIVTNENNEYTEIEKDITAMDIRVVDDLKAIVTENCVKCLILEAPERLAVIEKKLQEELKERFSVMRSKPFFLEVTQQNVHKGASLSYLVNKLGLTREQVIACGDSYNDLEMIRYAGLGVAMANAVDAVKEEADFITASNNEDGIAKVVEQFILETAEMIR